MTARNETASKPYCRTALLFIVYFLLVLWILHGLPLTVDDHLFRNIQFDSLSQAVTYLIGFGNGRFFGNGGIIFLMHHLVLSDFVRAAVLAGIAVLLPAVLSLHRPAVLLLSMFLLLTIAPGIFGQVYSWMSGFQNYVPPLLLLLLVLLLIRKTEEVESRTAGIICCFLVFVLSVCMQFYIEHSSCLNVLTAFLMVLWTRKRRSFKSALSFLAGTLVGLAGMFYAMLFVAPEIHGGVQSYFTDGFLGIIRGLLRNAVLLLGMYSENAIALSIMALFCSVLLAHYPDTLSEKARRGVSLGMLVPAAIFVLSLISSLKPFYGKLALAESILLTIAMQIYLSSVMYVLICLARHTGRQNITLAAVLFALALISILPILAVWPTGYRCLFHSCVMLFGSILLLAEEVQEVAVRKDKERIAAVAMTAALAASILCQISIFSDIRRMVSIRNAWLEEQAETGADSAAYFLIPTQYIYDTWNEENVHYATVGDRQIQLEILPADVWFRMYYYHYT